MGGPYFPKISFEEWKQKIKKQTNLIPWRCWDHFPRPIFPTPLSGAPLIVIPVVRDHLVSRFGLTIGVHSLLIYKDIQAQQFLWKSEDMRWNSVLVWHGMAHNTKIEKQLIIDVGCHGYGQNKISNIMFKLVTTLFHWNIYWFILIVNFVHIRLFLYRLYEYF